MHFVQVQTASVVVVFSKFNIKTSRFQLIEHHLLKEAEGKDIVTKTKHDIIGSHIDAHVQLAISDEEMNVVRAGIVFDISLFVMRLIDYHSSPTSIVI